MEVEKYLLSFCNAEWLTLTGFEVLVFNALVISDNNKKVGILWFMHGRTTTIRKNGIIRRFYSHSFVVLQANL